MMRLVKTLIATALSLPLLLLAGCKSIPSYSADYAQSRNGIQGIALDQAKAQDIGLRFTSAFNTLGTPRIRWKMLDHCMPTSCLLTIPYRNFHPVKIYSSTFKA